MTEYELEYQRGLRAFTALTFSSKDVEKYKLIISMYKDEKKRTRYCVMVGDLKNRECNLSFKALICMIIKFINTKKVSAVYWPNIGRYTVIKVNALIKKYKTINNSPADSIDEFLSIISSIEKKIDESFQG